MDRLLRAQLLAPCCQSFVKNRQLIMEIIAQWFDDLDDMVSSARLLRERFRSFSIALIILVTSLLVQIAGVLLALKHPPLACAIATILLVTLMYRSATAPRAAIQQSI
jgi:hypothetical protein